jgi:hypothetical protein
MLLVVTTLALTLLIVTDWLSFLRGPAPETSEWYWPHLLRPFNRWWPSILVAGLFWLVAAWWLTPELSDRRRNILALAGLILTSFLLQLALIYADRSAVAAEIVDRTLSNQASGFFEAAAEIKDMAVVLRSYPQQMTEFPSEHAQTHPPGFIVANWLTIRILARWPAFSEHVAQSIRPLRCTDLWLLNRPPEVSAALAFWSVLPLLAAAFCNIPAYGLARLLLRGRSRRLATLLAASIPALLLFGPKSVQIYALLVLFLFWTFQSALVKNSLWRFLLAGALISLMTYLSLGNAILLPLLILYAVLRQWLIAGLHQEIPENMNSWTSFLIQIFIFTAAAISLWLLAWMLWSIPPWSIAQIGLQQHYNLVTKFRRYDWWLIWNLIDLSLFAGWPLFLGFIGSIWLAIQAWRRKRVTAVELLTVCLLLLIIVLDISGSARGEVGRIWLFFIPLLAYPAARFWTLSLPNKHHAWLIFALQLLITVSLGLSWRPVRAVIVVAEEPTMPAASPGIELDGAIINQPFLLYGYSLQSDQLQAGGQLELTLFWQAEEPAQRPYTVFNHIVDKSGSLVAQQDSWPVNGQWPPTCWQAGDKIVDTYLIKLPDDLPSGSYYLYSGLYDAQSGVRVPLQDGSDTFQLGQITIQSP